MIFQHPKKKIVYETKCECGFTSIQNTAPPRKRLCPSCGKNWLKYEEVSATGPDLLLEEKR